MTSATCCGDRRHIASATAVVISATPVSWVPPKNDGMSTETSAAPTARQTRWASDEAMALSGVHVTQQSIPIGADSFAATAWASSVVLPYPAGAVTTVTGATQRAQKTIEQTRSSDRRPLGTPCMRVSEQE